MTQINPSLPPSPPPPPMPPKKKSYAWLIALLIGVGVIFIGFIAFIVVAVLFFLPSSNATLPIENEDYVAVLHIEGTISSSYNPGSLLSEGDVYNQQFLLDTVASLTEDANNQAILLYINSPGGEVYATDELYLALMDYKEATGRPIFAYCSQIAASGGYYLAAAADSIYMNRNCITGSIGVIAGTVIDISGFLEKQGIKATTIRVGANKAMGSYFEEFTEEQKKIYTSVLEDTYNQFVDIVAESRGMTVEEIKVLADGRIYSAEQAVGNGLVDIIARYEEAQAMMAESADLPVDIPFVDMYSDDASSISSLFAMVKAITQSDLDKYLSHLELPVDGPAYYYQPPV